MGNNKGYIIEIAYDEINNALSYRGTTQKCSEENITHELSDILRMRNHQLEKIKISEETRDILLKNDISGKLFISETDEGIKINKAPELVSLIIEAGINEKTDKFVEANLEINEVNINNGVNNYLLNISVPSYERIAKFIINSTRQNYSYKQRNNKLISKKLRFSLFNKETNSNQFRGLKNKINNISPRLLKKKNNKKIKDIRRLKRYLTNKY